MKTKYLLGVLLGGAMLAACSSDDLEMAPVAQGGNPSAPVFTVSFEDGLDTRAGWVGNNLGFTKGDDLLSLYHGIQLGSSSDLDFTKYGNAIYEVTGTGEGGLKLETRAYVDEGTAIMVYPADLTDANRQGVAPVVTIDLEQGKGTSLLTPYISEFLTIKGNDGKGDKNTAGYGREYDIVLRRLGSTVTFNIVPDPKTKPDFSAYPNIPEMEITGMSMHATNENAFTETISLTTSSTPIASGEKYKNWAYSSDVTLGSVEGKKDISTKDVTDNVATFTMLPNQTSLDISGVTLVVHTTYGTVTLNEESGAVVKNPVYKSEDNAYTSYKDKEYFTTKEAVNFLNKFLWTPSKTGTFKGENVGRYLPFSEVKVDLSKVEMDGMHIADERELNIALDVYEALKKTDKVRLILDGGKEGKFDMSQTTWERVAGIMADEESKITFAACNDEAPCTAIVLSNDGEVDVPELKFNNTNFETDKLQAYVNIELAEGTTWKFTGTREEQHLLEKVRNMIVQKGAILNLAETTINVKNNMVTANAFTVVNNGTVNISKTVYLMNKMTNHGTIEIPATANGVEHRFNMYSGGQLTNSEEQGEKATGWWTPANEDDKLGNAGGVINNAGTLSIVQGATDASIVNKGTINILNDDARTLITSNTTGNIGSPYNNAAQSGIDNVFGTINLKTKGAGNEKLSIATPGEDGFIKYVAETGADCKLANYAVVTGNTWPTGLAAKDYVEIKNGGKELQAPASLTVNALIIPEGKSIFISGASTVVVKEYLYVKGSITRAGGLFTVPGSTGVDPSGTDYHYVGYFGGDADKDKDNIFSMGQ